MRVLHVLASQGMGWSGGIAANLESLAQSRLSQTGVTFALVGRDQARERIRTWKPRLIVLHRASSWKGLQDLACLAGPRRVLIEHHYSAGFETHRVTARGRFRTMLRLTYGGMDRVVAISEQQRQWMRQAQLVSERKLRLIRSSRVVSTFLAVPPGPPLASPLRLAAYGRLNEQKGFDLLIDAVRLLPPGSVQLRLGGDAPLRTDLLERAGGDPAIQLVGRVDDVPGFLRDADVVAIPSRWEPWGNVCLEARAAGRPLLVQAVDGLIEQSHGCGIQVEQGSAAAWAEAIRTMADCSESQRQAWARHGRETAAPAWEQFLTAWDTLLQEFR
jgi:glycosyltransferase involved in cell wall biosynthesis